MEIYFLISLLCLSFTFILYLQTITKVPKSEKRDIFITIIIVGMIYITIDLLKIGLVNDLFTSPIMIQKIVYAIHCITSVILSYRWFAFAQCMQDSILHQNRILKLFCMLPMLFLVITSFLSIWTELFFLVDTNGKIINGNFNTLQFILTDTYTFFTITQVILKMLLTHDSEKKNNYMIIISYFSFPIIFGISQTLHSNMPYLCIGITLASLQHFLFSVNVEKEREISNSKIYSLTHLFISSYYLELKTGKWQYLSGQREKATPYLNKPVPKDYEQAILLYANNHVHKDDREAYLTMCNPNYITEHLSKENQSYTFTYRQISEGREKWYRMYAIATSYTPDNKPVHAIMAIIDVDTQITTNIQRQKVLEEALTQAENANKAKSVFLSNMSHDIRTPMNAIIGFTNLAKTRMKDTSLVEEYLEKIQSASQHLLNLINDILDMSRIESGKVQIEEEEMSLADVIHDMNNLILPMATEKGIKFITNPNFTNNYVYCDKLRLNQVLINLLGNAVKFTPQGGEISLSIEQTTDVMPNGYGKYTFRVKDNGVGIGEKFLNNIFQPFEREEGMDASSIQGTGLGLSIAKSIVELMNGKITVESELGKGTEFIVKVVFKIKEKKSITMVKEDFEKQIKIETKEKKETKTFIGKKLLLVDDNEINREIAIEILTSAGFIVTEAVNGKEAVEIIQNASENEFVAVLMDIQMPIMDGYEAATTIRNLSDCPSNNIPIIAMTANAFDEDKKKAFESGMNGHISKPIDVPVLFETLEQILK